MATVDELYLDNLDEFINDEGKIVTCKWLSRTLKTHVNQAKQMLYAFVQKQRNEHENDSLSVTYFISGLAKDSNGNKVHSVQVIPEENLEAVKTTLDPVTSCHIYSVQRAQLKDADALYLADYDLIKENILDSNRFSAITYSAAKLRSDCEIQKLQAQAQPTKAAPSLFKSEPQNGTSSSKAAPQSKPGGIAGMFATQGKKKPAEQIKKEKKDEPSPEKNVKGKAKQGAMMSFFAQHSNKPKSNSEEKTAEKDRPADSKKNNTPEKEKEQKDQKSKLSTNARRKKSESDNEDGQDKKRRRIQNKVFDSSSSEDEMETEEPAPSPLRELSPPPREPTPPPAKEPIPERKEVTQKEDKENEEESTIPDDSDEIIGPSPQSRMGKTGRKKLVSKQVIDEDGFMVTEKIWVHSDGSGDESTTTSKDTKPEKKLPKEQAKKTAAPKAKKALPKPAGKQTNLMSFFKKK